MSISNLVSLLFILVYKMVNAIIVMNPDLNLLSTMHCFCLINKNTFCLVTFGQTYTL